VEGIILLRHDDYHDCVACNNARRQANMGQYIYSCCPDGHVVKSKVQYTDPGVHLDRSCYSNGVHKRGYRRRSDGMKAMRQQQTAGLVKTRLSVYKAPCGMYHIGNEPEGDRSASIARWSDGTTREK
jgi:hypothetical protein